VYGNASHVRRTLEGPGRRQYGQRDRHNGEGKALPEQQAPSPRLERQGAALREVPRWLRPSLGPHQVHPEERGKWWRKLGKTRRRAIWQPRAGCRRSHVRRGPVAQRAI